MLSLKPIQGECTIQKWQDHATEMRKLLDGKDEDCRGLRNESRRLRYETEVTKTWDLYYNNVKLHDRVYEIEVLILYAENMLPKIANEKKLVEGEKFQTETLLQKCDTWIGVCLEGMNSLDRKLENELTRDDEGIEETKQEIKLLENSKANLKTDCLLAWETTERLEDVETKLELNLEFKREVLAMDIRCQAINKMDTEVSYKVEPTKGPEKMISLDEWYKAVYGLVEKGQNEILQSVKLRERMLATRGITLNEYSIQFDKTDFAMRKRIYEINREKNESQYQLMKVNELMEVTKAEWSRLELFLRDLKDDLKCAETRCVDRYFRPSVDATEDPPFTGMNKEVNDLRAKVEEIEGHLDVLKQRIMEWLKARTKKTFYNKLETDNRKLFLETEAKNKALQIQIQALDMRIAGRWDPMKIYAYDPKILTAKMTTQLPSPFSLYSSKY